MDYKINFNNFNSIFSLPSGIVDRHLKLCNEVQLKVVLYIFKNSQNLPNEEEIANYLNININEIENAIQFWVDRKILYIEQPQSININSDSKLKPKQKTKINKIPKPDSKFVAKKLREDKNLTALLDEAQLALKKTLSPGDISTLVYLSDTHGLPYEVLTLLLHYCSSMGKTNISAVERIGLEWSEREIYTLEQAEEVIKQMSDENTSWNKIAKIFGLNNYGKPTKAQLKYANTWLNEWKMKKPLIEEAYERCINTKGTFNMSYINGILKKWHENEIKSLDQLKKYEEGTKPKVNYSKTNPKKGSIYGSETASYDLDEYIQKSIFDEE